MTEPVRWGVLGARSKIARRAVLPAIAASGQATLVATASRAGEHPEGVAHRFPAYDDLLACDEVEAVYVPLPNGLHERWVVAAAAAGKHVLCEKPLAMRADSATRMAQACADAGVLLMEAYMTPFHPRTRLVWRLLADGRLGRLQHVSTQFTFAVADPGDHRVHPQLGGGAVFDVGIYCLEPLLTAAGWGDEDPLPDITARAHWSPPGVDLTTAGWLAFPSGVTGSFVTSLDAPRRQRLELVGSEAVLSVEDTAFTGGPDDTAIRFVPRGGEPRVLHSEPGAQYQLMIEHFSDAVRGLVPLERPPARSIALARVVDRIRDVAGRSVL